MSISQVFSVFDTAAEAFLPPFFMPTKGMAIRSFSDTVNSPDHHFNRHMDQYTLFHLGSFDDSNGKFEMFPTPQSLGLALEFKAAGVPARDC